MGNAKHDGFTWWRVYGWLGLIVGVPYSIALGVNDRDLSGLYFIFAAVGAFLCVFILKYSRAAFLWATILSFNPLVWIINGIYLRNRWNHPLVLKRLGNGQEEGVAVSPFTQEKASGMDSVSVPQVYPRSPEPSNDDFRRAAEEVDRSDYDKGLWERLYAEADGDLAKTRARYIAQRAKQLAKEAVPIDHL